MLFYRPARKSADYLRIRALWHMRGVEHRSASSGAVSLPPGDRPFARRRASGTCGVFAARADITDETWVTLRDLRRRPYDRDAVAALQVHHNPRMCGQRFAT